ncbi:MAG: glycoside hydrolase family 2 TIM barrel-domain containing protein [Candidatus Staskawiczbacteria bacterium]|nr:glycoside hydrolase family 2 TIM barrel-domain containing protein [Candidatus Staskawiczbacteria bacterium]
MNKMLKIIILVLFVLFVIFLLYFFIGKAPKQDNIIWGVNFSQMQAENLKLDWKETYLALLDDLKVKNLKLITNWDFVEGIKDDYYFKDIDWQIKEAESRGINLIYVVGMKTGRWPECHIPKWVNGLSEEQQQQEILKYIKEIILRYKDSKAITTWQVENEPLFKFGECPWYDKNFLKKEVELVKSLDPTRQIIISDSGEQSLWFGAAKIGDIVGTTMYRKAWVHITDSRGFYMDFPLPAISYWRKNQIIKKLFNKKVINIELQAEPWVRDVFADIPLEEQGKTMNLKQFQKNIKYAKETGLNQFYFWGSEWWYWMKEKQNKPEIWNEAKNYF